MRGFSTLKSATIAHVSIISNCNVSVLKNAASSLISGNLVAFPTETVYGLGADATNEDAVARIYKVKGRPVGHPLIVHISSMEHLNKWAKDIPEYAIKLARNFWPGPMTLILPRTELAGDFITGGQDNVGLRVPSHTIASALLKEFEAQGGIGIAAPSANRFGAVSPTTASSVEAELANYMIESDQIIDGGNCEIGIESTIIDCTKKRPLILRPGAVTNKMIQKTVGGLVKVELQSTPSNRIKVPGLFQSHYAPNAEVTLEKKIVVGDGFIALSSIPTPNGAVRLASPDNYKEFAQILYSALRSADAMGLKRIVIIPPLDKGIGIAINDRLKKAETKY
jgi:L-threonylcarbamoyladenylate synthase